MSYDPEKKRHVQTVVVLSANGHAYNVVCAEMKASLSNTVNRTKKRIEVDQTKTKKIRQLQEDKAVAFLKPNIQLCYDRAKSAEAPKSNRLQTYANSYLYILPTPVGVPAQKYLTCVLYAPLAKINALSSGGGGASSVSQTEAAGGWHSLVEEALAVVQKKPANPVVDLSGETQVAASVPAPVPRHRPAPRAG